LPAKKENLNNHYMERDDQTIHDPRYRPELQNQQAVRETNTIRIIGILLFLISIGIAIFGFIKSNESLSFYSFLKEFYANLSAELASIAITVLLIDYLNERRENRNLRGLLKREMGSEDNGIALRAVVELRAHGWLLDGSVKNAYLRRANLYRADLYNASMENCYLHKANLKRAFLEGADLSGADLTQADLTGATFDNSNLEGADLTDAILESTQFIGANLLNAKLQETRLASLASLEKSIMPNGEIYEDWLRNRTDNKRQDDT